MPTLFSTDIGPSSITAILLLLSWDFPESESSDELPYVSASALVHAAMRIGMHDPDKSQDFSISKSDILETEARRRFEIYTQCLLLYNR
jgi:hypothetical protein